MKRFCKQCSQPFYGRSDKKFCDDICRSTYNNLKLRPDRTRLNKVNNILRKNRKILYQLMPNDGTRTSLAKETLHEYGFNFNYNTHRVKTKTGSEFIFCYEYGYLFLPQENILLVKKEN